MHLITDSGSFPPWLWVFALFWSTYQATAGWVYGLFIHKQAADKVSQEKRVRYGVYALHHALLYFASSLFGFFCLELMLGITARVGSWSTLPASTGALLAGLAAFSIAGITGSLAAVLYRGGKLL